MNPKDLRNLETGGQEIGDKEGHTQRPTGSFPLVRLWAEVVAPGLRVGMWQTQAEGGSQMFHSLISKPAIFSHQDQLLIHP